MKLEIQWPLVLFSLLAGTGAAFFVFAALPAAFGAVPWPTANIVTIVAMIVVVLGGCCSVLHLAQFKHSVAVITNIFSMSGISLELLLLGGSLVMMLVFVLAWPVLMGTIWLPLIAIVGIVLSVLLAFFCGHGYVMPGRPQWDTKVLPYAYAGSALAIGAFLFVVAQVALGTEPQLVASLLPWYCVAAAACAISCLVYGVHVAKTSEAKSARLKGILYAGIIGCGVFVPLVCAFALFALADSAAGLAAAAAIGLAGSIAAGVSVRVAMWETSDCFLPLFDFSEIGKTM